MKVTFGQCDPLHRNRIIVLKKDIVLKHFLRSFYLSLFVANKNKQKQNLCFDKQNNYLHVVTKVFVRQSLLICQLLDVQPL